MSNVFDSPNLGVCQIEQTTGTFQMGKQNQIETEHNELLYHFSEEFP